jgi:hypothetical protein
LVTVLAVGLGFTVILKVTGVPVQVSPDTVFEGVIVMVAVTGFVLVFVATNEEMLPVPVAANPIEGVLLDQLKLVPVIAPLKLIVVVLLPLQTV